MKLRETERISVALAVTVIVRPRLQKKREGKQAGSGVPGRCASTDFKSITLMFADGKVLSVGSERDIQNTFSVDIREREGRHTDTHTGR